MRLLLCLSYILGFVQALPSAQALSPPLDTFGDLHGLPTDIASPRLVLAHSRRDLQDLNNPTEYQNSDQAPSLPSESRLSSSDRTASADTASADISDTFTSWFVLVGAAWCIFYACKRGGCCRGGTLSTHSHHAPPVHHIPAAHQHVAFPLATAQRLAGQPWMPAMDPRTGVAVTNVHVGQAHSPVRVQRVPTVHKVPTQLHRVGSNRWRSNPDEAKAAGVSPEEHPVGSHPTASTVEHVVTDDAAGSGDFHSVASTAEEGSLYLPPSLSVHATSSHGAASRPEAPEDDNEPLRNEHGHDLGVAHSGGELPLADIQGEESTMSDKECVICYDAVGDHVMIPCGHGGFCGSCAKDMCTGKAPPYTEVGGHVCPVCRAPVDSVVKVLLSTRVGGCSSAECVLVVDDENEAQPQMQQDMHAMHQAMLHAALQNPMSTVSPAHFVFHPAHTMGRYSAGVTHVQASPPGYPHQ